MKQVENIQNAISRRKEDFAFALVSNAIEENKHDLYLN